MNLASLNSKEMERLTRGSILKGSIEGRTLVEFLIPVVLLPIPPNLFKSSRT